MLGQFESVQELGKLNRAASDMSKPRMDTNQHEYAAVIQRERRFDSCSSCSFVVVPSHDSPAHRRQVAPPAPALHGGHGGFHRARGRAAHGGLGGEDAVQRRVHEAERRHDAVLGAHARSSARAQRHFPPRSLAGNLPWADYEDIAKNSAVALALPIAVGDNYLGYRLVGTTTNLFAVETTPGRKFRVAQEKRSKPVTWKRCSAASRRSS